MIHRTFERVFGSSHRHPNAANATAFAPPPALPGFAFPAFQSAPLPYLFAPPTLEPYCAPSFDFSPGFAAPLPPLDRGSPAVILANHVHQRGDLRIDKLRELAAQLGSSCLTMPFKWDPKGGTEKDGRWHPECTLREQKLLSET